MQEQTTMSNATDEWQQAIGKSVKAMGEKEEQRKAAEERNTDAAYLREAIDHADEIMAAAVERINARYGDQAWAHPELIAGFMQAAATIMAASITARSVEWAGSDR
jgi:hypothetical protein